MQGKCNRMARNLEQTVKTSNTFQMWAGEKGVRIVSAPDIFRNGETQGK